MHELAAPQLQLSLIVLTRRQLLRLIFVVCGSSTLILYMSKSSNTTMRKYFIKVNRSGSQNLTLVNIHRYYQNKNAR